MMPSYLLPISHLAGGRGNDAQNIYLSTYLESMASWIASILNPLLPGVPKFEVEPKFGFKFKKG